MIEAGFLSSIEQALGYLFEYGLTYRYSFEAIEEHVVSSSLIKGLENNDFDANLIPEHYVYEAYDIKECPRMELSFQALYLAESYLKLFFKTRRSFSCLFLYLPLSDFLEHYIFHEMDFSHLLSFFQEQVGETTLLKKLSQQKKIKISELAIISGINIHTLRKFAEDDAHLFAAPLSSLYALSCALECDLTLFVPKLNVFVDEGAYDFDRKGDYRKYFGLKLAQFFDTRVRAKGYVYDDAQDLFLTPKGERIIVVVSIECLSGLFADRDRLTVDTYLVIYDYAMINDFDACLEKLRKTMIEEALLIEADHVTFVKKNKSEWITSTLYRMLMVQAKSE